jgi:spermidine synthase
VTVDKSESAMDGPVLGRGRTLFLLATVFASGTAVMMVEMTAVRALQPFFGSTTYVWTNVIAVVLAALAVGYAIGGRLADRHPSPVLLYALIGAGGLLLLACGWLVTPVSRLFLTDGLDLEGVVSILTRGSLGVTLMLFAPPILLLGMISPLAIRLLSRGGVGRAAGRVFATSTLGSILGTYLPTFYLVPWIGSRGSILVSAGILIVAGAVGLIALGRSPRTTRAAAIILVLLAGRTAVAATTGDLAPARGAPQLYRGGEAEVLREVESEYQFLTVRRDSYPEGDAYEILTINEGIYTYHSLRREGRVLTDSRYYDDYSLLPFLLDLAPGDELRGCVVGLACGINVAQWKHFWEGPYRVRADGAELDPEIVRLGREFFDLPGPEADWLRVYEMDGRQMLELLPPDVRYHMLVVDAFTNELYIPFHLGTREFFELCRRRLEPGGVLAMNVYAVGEDAPNLRALENTLATVFGRCLRVKQYVTGNFLLLAFNGEGLPSFDRLGTSQIEARFGKRPETTEWGALLNQAEWFRTEGQSRTITPREDAWVLTDDHAPLEWLTDRFLDRTEDKALSHTDPRKRDLKALAGRQKKILWLIAAIYAVALLVLVPRAIR